MKPTKTPLPTLAVSSALLLAATLALAASTTRYLHVRVTNPTTHELVRVNVPLSLAEKVIPAINRGELRYGKVRIGNFTADNVNLRAILDALKAAPHAGRKPRVNARHLQRVQAALLKGARAHGFGADLWTLPRVTTVIERIAGVRYHPGHVWKILGAMNWTLQKPERQAKERNSDLVDYWKTVRWPALKKTLLASTPGSSSKTKPGSPSNPRSAGRGHREGKPRS